jgi:hypothetical protein
MSNAKSVKPESVEITIGGKTYVIRFTLNSFIELEETYGDVESAMKALSGEIIIDEATGMAVMEDITDEKTGEKKQVEKRKVSFKVVRDMLYAGLISAQPSITKADVGNFEFSDFSSIMEKLMKALTGSLPESKEENVKN